MIEGMYIFTSLVATMQTVVLAKLGHVRREAVSSICYSLILIGRWVGVNIYVTMQIPRCLLGRQNFNKFKIMKINISSRVE